MRVTTIVASTALFAGTVLCAMPAGAADNSAITARSAASTSLKRSLDKPLPEIRFNGTSFSDCIDFLTDASGVNVVVDWKALEAAKVTKDTPITLRLSSAVRLRKVMTLVLDQAAGAGVLTYYVDQGVLQITSQDAEDKLLVTRLYPIQDLLFQAPDYNNAPNLDLTQNGGNQTAGGGGGGGSGSGNLFTNTSGNSTGVNTATTRQERADEIIKLITDTIRPELWKVNGGNCTISFVRGNLVVSAPRSVQEQLSSQ
jgi:hypothetical protein